MNILPQIQKKIQHQVLPLIPKKWHPMFLLGINALSFTPFMSLNGNARVARRNKRAAMKQMWRLSKHQGLQKRFASLLLKLFPIDNNSVISMDFSSFGKFQVLWLGKQTKSGRSIPLWFDIILYPIENPTSQNLFILDVLREFLAVVNCRPKLVCDRGFIGEFLIHSFLDLGLKFYVRMKAGKTWYTTQGKRVLNKQWLLDQTGQMYGEKLRVVRSSKTLKRKLKAKECWYIITNDFQTTRGEIMDIYYYRFEIEETFKDLKHVLDMKPRWFQKIKTVKLLLWFQVLGIWLFFKGSRMITFILQRLKVHPKKKLSWVRQIFEKVMAERLRPVIPVIDFRKGVIAL